MKSSVAILVVSWVAGIVLGALHAPLLLLGACIYASVFLAYTQFLKSQFFVAIVGLFFLGFLYGQHPAGTAPHTCDVQVSSHAVLGRTYSLSPAQALYMFKRDDGCTLLVYGSRFPVLYVGTQADILGKQEDVKSAFKGIPGYAKYLQDNGVSLVVRDARISVIQEGSSFIDRVRVSLIHRIDRIFSEPDASLISAMLVGDSGMIPRDVQDEYRQSGIVHILSISGLHISIIVGLFVFIGEFLPLAMPIRNILILSSIWVYIFAIGFPPSAIRAAVFWTCYVLAYRLRALIGLPTVLLLTLMFLVTMSPGIIQSIGFQLSVVAVAGIGVSLFFVKRIRTKPFIQTLILLFGVSVGATIASIPLTAFYFGNFSLIGILVNAVAVPLSALALYGAIATLLVSVVSTPLSLMGALGVHYVLSWIQFAAILGSRVPYGHIEHMQVSLKMLALYYSVLAGGVYFLMRYLKISWRQWWI